MGIHFPMGEKNAKLVENDGWNIRRQKMPILMWRQET